MPSLPAAPSTSVRSRAARLLLTAICVSSLLAVAHVATAAGRARTATAARASTYCAAQDRRPRNPANPLDLPTPPGSNPLTGARFFVPGPAKGPAAGAIARLFGLDPATMPVDESWAQFSARLAFGGSLHNRLIADPALARKVAQLSMIAAQPDVQRISSYSWGGTPSGIFKQTSKDFCQNMTADPGTIPIFNTYFLHPTLGACPTPAEVKAYDPRFHRQIDAMAKATGRRRSVWLLEIDAIGSSSCVRKMGSLPAWEADLRYEMRKMQALPHTVVYVEGGYSDSNSVGYTARVLNAIGVNTIRGFFTNDTHEAWTINEDRWATRIARRTHGAHFIVDTADNGHGPLLNHDRVRYGNEQLCNPPGRGLGIADTTNTPGFKYADAYMWTHPPGNSSGSCHGGPAPGVFWPARAEGEAQRANNQLGPRLPSRPY